MMDTEKITLVVGLRVVTVALGKKAGSRLTWQASGIEIFTIGCACHYERLRNVAINELNARGLSVSQLRRASE